MQESTLVDASIFPTLVVKVGGRVVREVELRTEVRIGRAEDNDLDLTDPKVSRHHARVYREGAVYRVVDLESANGTRVNGVRITAPYQLKHGDRIAVGDVELIYQEPGQVTDETIVAPSPAMVGAQPTVTRKPIMAVPPPPVPVSEPETGKGSSRGLTVALVLVAGIVIVALLVVVLFQIGILGPREPATPPTQTPQIVVATTVAPMETEVSVETPLATMPPAVTSAVQQGFDQALDDARILAQQSNFEAAISTYQDLVQQAPEDARPEVGWAWALIWDDEAEEALTHALKAVELDPESADAAAVLARAFVETGDKAQALNEAQRAVELGRGNATAHAVLAEAYSVNRRIPEAVEEADLALVQDINSAEAHRIRGWLYHIADNDMGRAAGELQIAAGLQPELWLRRHELGSLLLMAEDYTTAIMAFQDALGIRPKAITYTAIGEAYYRLGQYDQAKASLQQAVDAGAEDLNTYALLGVTFAHLGNCEEAETYYDQALEMDGMDPLAREARDLCEGSGPSPTPSITTVSESAPTPVSSAQPESTPVPSQPLPSLSGRVAFPVWNLETGNYDVYMANVDGSGRQLVVEEMHQPDLSPDGNWLVVNGERHEHMNLFIVHPDGSGLKEISAHLEDALPQWSSDGESIAFSSTMHGDKQSRVYVIDKVPFEGRQEEGRVLNFGPDEVRGEYPAWTPDGQIVYSGCDSTVEPARCGLFIMPSAPGVQTTVQLTEQKEDTAPAAYGTKIAFSSNRDGNWEVYVINEDGSDLERLTDNAADDGLPTWSPDGKAISFVSNQGGAWAMWVMSPDGSNRRKLFDIGGGGLTVDWQHERISWGP